MRLLCIIFFLDTLVPPFLATPVILNLISAESAGLSVPRLLVVNKRRAAPVCNRQVFAV